MPSRKSDSGLVAIAPRLARAQAAEQSHRMRSLSRCWQNNGWHAHGAGPCFGSLEAAMRYRDREEQEFAAIRERMARRDW